MATINSTSALLTTAKQNPALFQSIYNRAPKSIQFQGKTYLREAASSIESKLWYLGAAAKMQPSSISVIASKSFGFDGESFGLDPDRSEVDEAERALREAQAAANKVKAKLDAQKRQVKSFQDRMKDATKRLAECDKRNLTGSVGGDVLAGILTIGGSAIVNEVAGKGGCRAYEAGQVQLWKDRIQAWKTGAMVGMAGQEGFAVPVNDGIVQNEGLLADANAAVQAAQAEVTAARSRYDAQAKAMRDEEAKAARQQQAEAYSQQLADFRAQQAAAQQQAALSQSATYYSGVNEYAQQQTDPGYVYDDGSYAGGAYGDDGAYYENPADSDGTNWYENQLDANGKAMAEQYGADETDVGDFAEDYLGLRNGGEVSQVGYVSPYGFDTYYADMRAQGADCGCGCNGGNESCDGFDEDFTRFKAMMFDAGWSRFSSDVAFGADKITEPGEQGYGSPSDWGTYSAPLSAPPLVPARVTGDSSAPFDFSGVLMLIITAVISLAPLLISTFSPPVAVQEANPPHDAVPIQASVTDVPPPAPPAPAPLWPWVIGGIILAKVLA